jgi:hypothetical protein
LSWPAVCSACWERGLCLAATPTNYGGASSTRPPGPSSFFSARAKRLQHAFKAKAGLNRDVPDSVADMVLGLNLLFWAFFLQMVALFFEIKK